MGLRNLRLAAFKTLFAGSRRQNLRVHMATRDPQATRHGFMGLRSLRLAAFKTLFAGSRPLTFACTWLQGTLRPPGKVFMGLRSLRLAAFKTLFAGSRPLNLRLHMATRQGFNGPASKAFSRGYPALRPPGKVLQGFMGLRSLRLAGFKTFSRGPGVKTFACTWLQGTLRPPGKVLGAFEACVWPPSKPFSRGPGL